jgi:hypothetical protein
MAGKLPFGASGRGNIHVRTDAESAAIAVDKNPPFLADFPTGCISLMKTFRALGILGRQPVRTAPAELVVPELAAVRLELAGGRSHVMAFTALNQACDFS